jgi:hypothetical protein
VKPPVMTRAKEDPNISCRSNVTTQTWDPFEGCLINTRSFVFMRSETWCTVPYLQKCYNLSIQQALGRTYRPSAVKPLPEIKKSERSGNCRTSEGGSDTSVNSKLIGGSVGRKASEVIIIRNYDWCDD